MAQRHSFRSIAPHQPTQSDRPHNPTKNDRPSQSHKAIASHHHQKRSPLTQPCKAIAFYLTPYKAIAPHHTPKRSPPTTPPKTIALCLSHKRSPPQPQQRSHSSLTPQTRSPLSSPNSDRPHAPQKALACLCGSTYRPLPKSKIGNPKLTWVGVEERDPTKKVEWQGDMECWVSQVQPNLRGRSHCYSLKI
jgi:hypothetical protein